MSNVLVTFVGTSTYDETQYQLNGFEPIKTSDVAVALATWLHPTRVVVVLTEKAKIGENYSRLKTALTAKNITISEIHLKSGKAEDHLWDLFGLITKELQNEPNDIIFDLTHGYRSHPLIGLLTCAYLKQMGGRKITKLLYGAYEKDNLTNPIWDLSPFLDLFEWSFAAGLFMRSGDAREFARILKDTQTNFQKNYRKSLPENGPKASYGDPSVPWDLQELAKNLGTVTDNLLVGRPDALQEKLDILIKDLEETRAEVETFALPLAYILDKVKAEYEKLKVCPLESQLQLIKWYSEKGLVHQAIGLASEWLTTILCQLAKVDPQIFKHRESLSRKMNAQRKGRPEDPDQQPDLENLDHPILPDPLPKPLTDWWGNIRDKRNDLMHFGQGKDTKDTLKAEIFMNFLKDLPEQLKKVFDSLPKS